MSVTQHQDEASIRELILKLISRELQPSFSVSDDDQDLMATGVIDSMGWVGILSGIEEATGIRNFGASWPEGRAQSVRTLVDAVREELDKLKPQGEQQGLRSEVTRDLSVSVAGWGYCPGSRRVDAATVEQECGLPGGAILDRAGIRSVSRAGEGETELTLGAKAAELALEAAQVELDDVDVLVVTSATSLGFPSLAALLHTRLLLRESCVAIDVGGACVGTIQALATAKALLVNARRQLALVVASEVNSRRLCHPGVPGEFRGLFGDGACAFVLSSDDSDGKAWRMGDFVSGCSGAFSSSLQVALRPTGKLEVDFKGEQLASAAITTINQVIGNLEDLTGIGRSEVEYFALHEPNPRLAEIVAQRAKIPLERLARTAETCGNLGSVTCGMNLCKALTHLQERSEDSRRRIIYVAAVGPGILWAGTYLFWDSMVRRVAAPTP